MHSLFHFDAETFELAGAVRVEPGAPASEPRTLTVTCTGRRERNGAGWKPPAIEWSVNGETGSTIVRPAGAGVSAEVRRRHTFDRHRASNRGAVVAQNGGVSGPPRRAVRRDDHGAPPCATISDPLHPVVGEFLDAARKEEGGARKHLSDWRDRIRQEANEPDVEMPREAVNAALNALRPHYHLLGEPYGELAESGGWPLLPLSGDDHDLSNLVKELLARRGESAPEKDLPDRLPGVLEALRREELRRSDETATEETARETAERIAEDIAQCEARLKEIDQRYPRLDDDVEAFHTGEASPGLPAILESFRDHAPAWLAAAEARSTSLAMLVTELRRVRPEDAAKCATELRIYLEPRRQALEERQPPADGTRRLAGCSTTSPPLGARREVDGDAYSSPRRGIRAARQVGAGAKGSPAAGTGRAGSGQAGFAQCAGRRCGPAHRVHRRRRRGVRTASRERREPGQRGPLAPCADGRSASRHPAGR